METATSATISVPPFVRIAEDGAVEFSLHKGQDEALHAPERFIAIIAGTQSGKTELGPLWLSEEIARRGPGDYLAVAPSYTLMQKKMLPAFCRLFETYLRLGTYRSGERIFHHKDGITKIFFGHADDPESLESATAKAAWLDEAGQNRFKLGSWEAIQRRVAVNSGRILIGTTPYNMGWLKQQVWDRYQRKEPDYRVVNFSSIMNPAFPREEYERAKRELPAWKFAMFYDGLFTRPAGMIYDCFTDAHKIPRFTIPDHWPRYGGLDFGGVNTAAVFIAEETNEIAGPVQRSESYPLHNRTGRLFVYREYKAGNRTAKEHVAELRRGEPVGATWAGGSKSEGQWRSEFRQAGLPMREPVVTEVEVGINRVYGAFQRNELFVFDDLHGLLDDIGSYSREVDDAGGPTEKIEDKETHHYCDALRYVCCWLRQEKRRINVFM